MCFAYKSAWGALNTFSPQRQVSGEVRMQSRSRGLDPIAMTMATVGMGMSLYSARQMTEEEYLKHLNAWVESCWGGAALTEVNDVCGCDMSQKVCDGGGWESPFNAFVMLFERKSGWMLSPNIRICQIIITYCSSFPWKSTTYCTSSLTKVLVRENKCISQCQVTTKNVWKKY